MNQYYECNKDVKVMTRYQQNKECAKIYRKRYYRNSKKSDISKSLQYYTCNRDKLACKPKLLYSSNRDFAEVVLKRARKYYARNRTSICACKWRIYNMAEPKPCVKEKYVLTAKKALLHNKKVMKELEKYFKSQHKGAFEKMNKCSHRATIAQLAAHRLIAKAWKIRMQYVGLLLKTVKHVCGKGQYDFG